MAALPCQAQAKPGRRTLTRRILPGTIYCVPLVYLSEKEKKTNIFYWKKKREKKERKKTILELFSVRNIIKTERYSLEKQY